MYTSSSFGPDIQFQWSPMCSAGMIVGISRNGAGTMLESPQFIYVNLVQFILHSNKYFNAQCYILRCLAINTYIHINIFVVPSVSYGSQVREFQCGYCYQDTFKKAKLRSVTSWIARFSITRGNIMYTPHEYYIFFLLKFIISYLSF